MKSICRNGHISWGEKDRDFSIIRQNAPASIWSSGTACWYIEDIEDESSEFRGPNRPDQHSSAVIHPSGRSNVEPEDWDETPG
jgi:hypothetical protein